MIKWLGESEIARNGHPIRNGILADMSGWLKFNVWKTSWFQLDESKVYIFTNLELGEYFGMYLASRHNSTYGEANEAIEAAWPPSDQLKDMIVCPEEPQKVVVRNVDIDGVTLEAHALCPTCNQSNNLTGDFIDCISAKCGSTFKLKKAKIVMPGSITIDSDGTTLELLIDASIIDATFGDGTARRYATQITEVKHRLLRLENLDITYQSLTKKVIDLKVVKDNDVPAKKSKPSE